MSGCIVIIGLGQSVVAAPVIQDPQFAQGGDPLGCLGRALDEILQSTRCRSELSGLAVGYGQAQTGLPEVGVVRRQIGQKGPVVSQCLLGLTALASGACNTRGGISGAATAQPWSVGDTRINAIRGCSRWVMKRPSASTNIQ